MPERVWDRFLSERDRLLVARTPERPPAGLGPRPALLLVDNYVAALGDQPQPILGAVAEWPQSTGEDGWTAVGHIARLLAAARSAGVPVVHVTGLPEEESGVIGWFDFRAGGRARDGGARNPRRFDITPQLAPQPGEAVIRKNAPSAFWGTPLIGHLGALGVDSVIVAGESTSGCVRATVVDAASFRLRVVVPEECVYDRHEAAHAINLFDMSQKYADVMALADVLGSLAGLHGAQER